MKKSLATSIITAVITVPALMIGSSGFAAQQSNLATPVADAPVVLAHRAHNGERGAKHRKGHMRKMFRGLDLTDAQRNQLFELRHANMPKLREIRMQKRQAQRGVREMVMSGQLDQEKLDALSATLGQASAEMVRARAVMRVAMMNVLTTEQRAKLKERFERKHKRN